MQRALREAVRHTVVIKNEEGLVSLKVQYIDDTKIEPVMNKYTFVRESSVEKNKAKLEAMDRDDTVPRLLQGEIRDKNRPEDPHKRPESSYTTINNGYVDIHNATSEKENGCNFSSCNRISPIFRKTRAAP